MSYLAILYYFHSIPRTGVRKKRVLQLMSGDIRVSMFLYSLGQAEVASEVVRDSGVSVFSSQTHAKIWVTTHQRHCVLNNCHCRFLEVRNKKHVVLRNIIKIKKIKNVLSSNGYKAELGLQKSAEGIRPGHSFSFLIINSYSHNTARSHVQDSALSDLLWSGLTYSMGVSDSTLVCCRRCPWSRGLRQKSFTQVWRWHQLLSGSLPNGLLSRELFTFPTYI